jgi:hypothetical protein
VSTAQNNALVPILPGVIALPVIQSTSLTINSGDLVFWDAGGTLGLGKYTLGSITTDAQAGSSIGVSQDSQPINSIGQSPGLTAVYKTPDYLVVNFNVVFKFTSTAGDTYNWFDPLYIANSDPQTVTNTAGGKVNVLARVYFPPSDENGNTISPPVAGGATVTIRGVVKPNYPNLGVL